VLKTERIKYYTNYHKTKMSDSWGQFVTIDDDEAFHINYQEAQGPIDLKMILNTNNKLYNFDSLTTIKIITLCWICLLIYLTKKYILLL
jgi:hypothetical protein